MKELLFGGLKIGYLRELNLVSILFRIFLSVMIGGFLGMERGKKNRPAGLRTYILVCLGSALVMMTNQYVYLTYQTGDPMRLGAQVISGVGFLGAGTIILTGRNKIMGITTAAGLWTAACGGLAIGVGFYEGAVLGGIVIAFTVSGLLRFDIWLRKKSKYLELYVEYNAEKGAFSGFLQYAREHQFEVKNIQISKGYMWQSSEGRQRTLSYIVTVSS
ncbi:MAG: MgtC/SapB family protein, partial [Lachnospiraceae bacterium]|nr:MgtC/SapB family protein [Lachnospiraceae bacterium]